MRKALKRTAKNSGACAEWLEWFRLFQVFSLVVGRVEARAIEMKIHAVKFFSQRAAAFLALCEGLIADFLENLCSIFAFFALVFINGHDGVPR